MGRSYSHGMEEESVIQYITSSLAGVDVFDSSGNRFFFFDPGGDMEPDRLLPFATLVTSDEYDSASDLDRPGIYRLNIGVSPDTYRRLFGPGVPRAGADGIVDTGHDFTALDQIMPHPIYAPQFWVCVLNPSAMTFESVKPLLAEAHQRSASRHARMNKRGET